MNPILPTILSLFIPGSGQFLLKNRWRGITIFLVTPLLVFLVHWAFNLVNQIGIVSLGGLSTSWLWLPLILFWLWNVWDAYRLAQHKSSFVLIGILLAMVILYVIAWDVTNVRLDRLFTRIGDIRTIVTALVNPDLISISINGEKQTCNWKCLSEYAGDKIARREPKGLVSLSDNFYDIIGRVKDGPPPWLVNLGLVSRSLEVRSFWEGKLIETIAIGLLATLFSTIIAMPISFLAAHNIMSRVPGGLPIYYFVRFILNIVRAVDTIVWGLLIVVWVGLGSFAGVLALTIHSIAALAKLYSEEIEHIDPGPVEAVEATGSNFFQIIRYAVIPQIIPPFLGYTLLRWDINMRSATIVGFVAGGGIGFFVVETIRGHAYQQYAAALWFVAVVIILVDFVSGKMRENILQDKPIIPIKGPPTLRTIQKVAYAVLGIALFIYCCGVCRVKISDMFEPAPTFLKVLSDFVSIDLSQPVMDEVIKNLIATVFQALLATTFGAIFAIPFSFLAAKNLTGKSWFLIWIYYLTRSAFNILRSIEALLYVAIFVFWVGIGPFAGTLALAITTFALLGKLFSEAIENIDFGPMEAISATGANRLQTIFYAIVPQIVPPFISYLIYQWDINIRMATIIGFAGGGGIGLTLQGFFALLRYHAAGTVVLFIVIVVAMMDFASAKLREKLV